MQTTEVTLKDYILAWRVEKDRLYCDISDCMHYLIDMTHVIMSVYRRYNVTINICIT